MIDIKCLMCKKIFKVKGRNTKTSFADSGICANCMTELHRKD